MRVKCEPSGAERARSILASADSLTVTVGDTRAHLVGGHALDRQGDLLLSVPSGSALLAFEDESPALVELTDVAPVAVRQRLRAQLAIAGWLTVEGGLLRFAPVVVRLTEGQREHTLQAEDVVAATPDPLAGTEAELLCHLADAHVDAVERLSRLLPAQRLQGVRRILPLRLDRFGIVLRLEFAGRDSDVRLPFAAPLREPEDAPKAMLALLASTPRCPRRP